jgi:di/tricarboxylate transporter
VAEGLLVLGQTWPPALTLGLLFAVTLLLSNVVNNAAAALLMAPIGFRLAEAFGTSPDPFLMAVAIAASSAFLTPIGHQSNTLVMGPGGYRFGDYWKVGLPLTLVVAATALPLILWFWPMGG